jgi:Domain of unknown function (DUF4157)
MKRQHKASGTRRPPIVREVLASPGRPFEPDTCARFSSRFGHDFSRVRVHTDARAGESARALSAHAYTVGRHIVFGENGYRPGSEDGDRLIAHELTHVLQQGEVTDVAATKQIVLDEPGSRYDAEASRIAATVTRSSRSHEAAESTAVAPAPIAATQVRRAPGTVVLQRALLGGLIGAGIGGVLGGLVGFAIGGPVGALVGGLLGAAVGGLIGATLSPFPTYTQVVGDAAVQARVSAAWANTLAAATPVGRREEGFWIRLNKGTDKYEFTPTILGPTVGPAAGGAVTLGARPADVSPGTSSAIYTVGSFHTHTPTAFRPVGRPIGPSGADNAADTSDDVVGVVYDYTESPPGSGAIPAGHPLGSPARLYHSGPNRRQKM